MAKSENKRKEKRLKKHLHLNISPELYEKIKKIGVNVSQFVEEALNALISGTNLQNIQNTLILRVKSEKECCEPDSNRRPSDYESDALTEGILEKGGEYERIKKFKRASEKSKVVNRLAGKNPGEVLPGDVKDGDMLDPNGGYSMAAFMASRKSDYLKFKERTDPRTVKEYVSAIGKLSWVVTYDDLLDKISITKSEKDGIYEVLSYLEKYKEDKSGTYNGTIYQKYRTKALSLSRASKGSRKSQKTNELILFPEVIRDTMELLPDDVQMFFALSIFGARTAQLHRLFESEKLKITQSPDKSFFWVDGEAVAAGHKRVFQYFFPAWMLPVVENYRNLRGKEREEPEGAYSEAVQDVSRMVNENVPCNLSSLRKFAKTVLTESGLPDGVAEYTQGRVAAGVGAKDYDNLGIAAKRDFGKTLPYWEKYFQLPDWMSDPEEIKHRLDVIEAELSKGKRRPAITKKSSGGRSQLADDKRADIIKRLKAGESRRAIMAAVGVSRATVDNIAKGLK